MVLNQTPDLAKVLKNFHGRLAIQEHKAVRAQPITADPTDLPDGTFWVRTDTGHLYVSVGGFPHDLAPVQASVDTQETTSSTGYTNLATTGPTISGVNLVAGQTVTITFGARMKCSTGGSGHAVYMSVDISGASSLAASDSNCIEALSSDDSWRERTFVFSATSTGAHTFQCKYKSASGADTCTYLRRRLIVRKF